MDRMMSPWLTVGSSNALLGVFGAFVAYSAINVESDWNSRGEAVEVDYVLNPMLSLLACQLLKPRHDVEPFQVLL